MKEENAPAQPADADLPPEVQADQCLLEAEKTLPNSDSQTAETAFKKIKALNIEEPPPDFFFLYGKFLMENCNAVNLAKAVENSQVQGFLDKLLKARSLLKQFLTQVQRTAANYKPALELLSTCQSTIKAVTPAAKEFGELQKFKNKRAGETLLIHLAADYTEIVESLLAAVADVQAKNDNGETPLHLAAFFGKTKVVKALLTAGADVYAKNDNDGTPLRVIAEKGQIEVVKTLLAAVDVNAKGKYGKTPFYFAARKGKTEVAEILHVAMGKRKPERWKLVLDECWF